MRIVYGNCYEKANFSFVQITIINTESTRSIISQKNFRKYKSRDRNVRIIWFFTLCWVTEVLIFLLKETHYVLLLLGRVLQLLLLLWIVTLIFLFPLWSDFCAFINVVHKHCPDGDGFVLHFLLKFGHNKWKIWIVLLQRAKLFMVCWTHQLSCVSQFHRPQEISWKKWHALKN